MQEEAYHIMVSIAHTQSKSSCACDDHACVIDAVTDPTSNDDFELLIDAHYIPDVDPGHECYPLPQNFSAGIAEGANATLQLVYIADFDDNGEENGQNETFYACAGRWSSWY
jgi:hypothetical protein